MGVPADFFPAGVLGSWLRQNRSRACGTCLGAGLAAFEEEPWDQIDWTAGAELRAQAFQGLCNVPKSVFLLGVAQQRSESGVTPESDLIHQHGALPAAFLEPVWGAVVEGMPALA